MSGGSPGITVAELVARLRERRARLPFEVGAFVTLKTVEWLIDAPGKVSPEAVSVGEDGSVTVTPGDHAPEPELTREAQELLAQLLLGAGTAVPDAMLRLVEHGPRDGSGSLSRFRDELEASLLPLNRAASQRILSRLVRETRREGGAGPPTVDEQAVDADLDAFLAGDAIPERPSTPITGASRTPLHRPAPVAPAPATPQPAPSSASAPSAPGSTDEGGTAPGGRPPSDQETVIERRLHRPAPATAAPEAAPHRPAPVAEGSLESRVDPTAPQKPAAKESDGSATLRDPAPAGEVPVPVAPSSRPVLRTSELDLPSYGQDRSRKGIWAWTLAFAVLIGATAAMVGFLRPDVYQRMLGNAPPPRDHEAERAAREAEARRQAEAEARERFGDLFVRVDPEGSQVLLKIGRGPAMATHLPVGVAHEFVAIAEGKEPARAIVPSDAEWSEGEDGLRYELAMQAGEEDMAFESLVLGESRLPREPGQNRGRLGTVRVLTNPPGADVYLLIGFGPEIRVRDLRADQTYELLVYHRGYRPEVVELKPEDWEMHDEGKRAEVEITLEERRGRRRRR